MEVKDLYLENYKTLMKEIEHTDKWRDIPYSWIGRINIIKMIILLKTTHRFNIIPIKIPMEFFFTELEQIILKHMETQKTPNSHNTPEKEEQTGGIMLSGFRLYYKAIITKTVWSWHKNRHIGQWNT